MYDGTDTSESPPTYLRGDIVWVKLSGCWWPAEVKSQDDLPNDLLADFKKPPLAIVQFFDEDSYEYIKSWNQIRPYNCDKKTEFIQKGMAGFRSKVPHMAKFPKDIGKAEEKTNGNPNILSDPQYLPVKKINYNDIFGSPSPKKQPKGKLSVSSLLPRKSSSKDPSAPPHITHRRFLGNDDYRAYILPQYVGKDRQWDSDDEDIKKMNEENDKEMVCHSCSFVTKRLEVMMMHTKMHIQGVYITSKRKYKKSKDLDQLSDSEPELNSSKSSPPKPKQRKKKAKPEKTKYAFSDLLDEWSDTDEETEGAAKEKTPKTYKNKNRSRTKAEIESTELNDNSDEENIYSKSSGSQKSPRSPKIPESSKPVSISKNTQEDIKNCFDFDEEEEDEILLPTSVGRKIPRVIPEKPKASITELLEQSQIEEQIEIEIVDAPIIIENSKADSNNLVVEDDIKKVEILKTSESFNRIPNVDDSIENAFKELMEETEVPLLDSLSQNLKPEQNFHDARTIKFPDKGGTSSSSKGSTPTSGGSSDSLKAEGGKKKFVTSFEGFEAGFRKLSDQQRKIDEGKTSEKSKYSFLNDKSKDKSLDAATNSLESTKSTQDLLEILQEPIELPCVTAPAETNLNDTAKSSQLAQHSKTVDHTSKDTPEIFVKPVTPNEVSEADSGKKNTRQSRRHASKLDEIESSTVQEESLTSNDLLKGSSHETEDLEKINYRKSTRHVHRDVKTDMETVNLKKDSFVSSDVSKIDVTDSTPSKKSSKHSRKQGVKQVDEDTINPQEDALSSTKLSEDASSSSILLESSNRKSTRHSRRHDVTTDSESTSLQKDISLNNEAIENAALPSVSEETSSRKSTRHSRKQDDKSSEKDSTKHRDSQLSTDSSKDTTKSEVLEEIGSKKRTKHSRKQDNTVAEIKSSSAIIDSSKEPSKSDILEETDSKKRTRQSRKHDDTTTEVESIFSGTDSSKDLSKSKILEETDGKKRTRHSLKQDDRTEEIEGISRNTDSSKDHSKSEILEETDNKRRTRHSRKQDDTTDLESISLNTDPSEDTSISEVLEETDSKKRTRHSRKHDDTTDIEIISPITDSSQDTSKSEVLEESISKKHAKHSRKQVHKAAVTERISLSTGSSRDSSKSKILEETDNKKRTRLSRKHDDSTADTESISSNKDSSKDPSKSEVTDETDSKKRRRLSRKQDDTTADIESNPPSSDSSKHPSKSEDIEDTDYKKRTRHLRKHDDAKVEVDTTFPSDDLSKFSDVSEETHSKKSTKYSRKQDVNLSETESTRLREIASLLTDLTEDATSSVSEQSSNRKSTRHSRRFDVQPGKIESTNQQNDILIADLHEDVNTTVSEEMSNRKNTRQSRKQDIKPIEIESSVIQEGPSLVTDLTEDTTVLISDKSTNRKSTRDSKKEDTDTSEIKNTNLQKELTKEVLHDDLTIGIKNVSEDIKSSKTDVNKKSRRRTKQFIIDEDSEEIIDVFKETDESGISEKIVIPEISEELENKLSEMYKDSSQSVTDVVDKLDEHSKQIHEKLIEEQVSELKTIKKSKRKTEETLEEQKAPSVSIPEEISNKGRRRGRSGQALKDETAKEKVTEILEPLKKDSSEFADSSVKQVSEEQSSERKSSEVFVKASSVSKKEKVRKQKEDMEKVVDTIKSDAEKLLERIDTQETFQTSKKVKAKKHSEEVKSNFNENVTEENFCELRRGRSKKIKEDAVIVQDDHKKGESLLCEEAMAQKLNSELRQFSDSKGKRIKSKKKSKDDTAVPVPIDIEASETTASQMNLFNSPNVDILPTKTDLSLETSYNKFTRAKSKQKDVTEASPSQEKSKQKLNLLEAGTTEIVDKNTPAGTEQKSKDKTFPSVEDESILKEVSQPPDTTYNVQNVNLLTSDLEVAKVINEKTEEFPPRNKRGRSQKKQSEKSVEGDTTGILKFSHKMDVEVSVSNANMTNEETRTEILKEDIPKTPRRGRSSKWSHFHKEPTPDVTVTTNQLIESTESKLESTEDSTDKNIFSELPQSTFTTKDSTIKSKRGITKKNETEVRAIGMETDVVSDATISPRELKAEDITSLQSSIKTIEQSDLKHQKSKSRKHKKDEKSESTSEISDNDTVKSDSKIIDFDKASVEVKLSVTSEAKVMEVTESQTELTSSKDKKGRVKKHQKEDTDTVGQFQKDSEKAIDIIVSSEENRIPISSATFSKPSGVLEEGAVLEYKEKSVDIAKARSSTESKCTKKDLVEVPEQPVSEKSCLNTKNVDKTSPFSFHIRKREEHKKTIKDFAFSESIKNQRPVPKEKVESKEVENKLTSFKTSEVISITDIQLVSSDFESAQLNRDKEKNTTESTAFCDKVTVPSNVTKTEFVSDTAVTIPYLDISLDSIPLPPDEPPEKSKKTKSRKANRWDKPTSENYEQPQLTSDKVSLNEPIVEESVKQPEVISHKPNVDKIPDLIPLPPTEPISFDAIPLDSIPLPPGDPIPVECIPLPPEEPVSTSKKSRQRKSRWDVLPETNICQVDTSVSDHKVSTESRFPEESTRGKLPLLIPIISKKSEPTPDNSLKPAPAVKEIPPTSPDLFESSECGNSAGCAAQSLEGCATSGELAVEPSSITPQKNVCLEDDFNKQNSETSKDDLKNTVQTETIQIMEQEVNLGTSVNSDQSVKDSKSVLKEAVLSSDISPSDDLKCDESMKHITEVSQALAGNVPDNMDIQKTVNTETEPEDATNESCSKFSKKKDRPRKHSKSDVSEMQKCDTFINDQIDSVGLTEELHVTETLQEKAIHVKEFDTVESKTGNNESTILSTEVVVEGTSIQETAVVNLENKNITEVPIKELGIIEPENSKQVNEVSSLLELCKDATSEVLETKKIKTPEIDKEGIAELSLKDSCKTEHSQPSEIITEVINKLVVGSQELVESTTEDQVRCAVSSSIEKIDEVVSVEIPEKSPKKQRGRPRKSSRISEEPELLSVETESKCESVDKTLLSSDESESILKPPVVSEVLSNEQTGTLVEEKTEFTLKGICNTEQPQSSEIIAEVIDELVVGLQESLESTTEDLVGCAVSSSIEKIDKEVSVDKPEKSAKRQRGRPRKSSKISEEPVLHSDETDCKRKLGDKTVMSDDSDNLLKPSVVPEILSDKQTSTLVEEKSELSLKGGCDTEQPQSVQTTVEIINELIVSTQEIVDTTAEDQVGCTTSSSVEKNNEIVSVERPEKSAKKQRGRKRKSSKISVERELHPVESENKCESVDKTLVSSKESERHILESPVVPKILTDDESHTLVEKTLLPGEKALENRHSENVEKTSPLELPDLVETARGKQKGRSRKSSKVLDEPEKQTPVESDLPISSEQSEKEHIEKGEHLPTETAAVPKGLASDILIENDDVHPKHELVKTDIEEPIKTEEVTDKVEEFAALSTVTSETPSKKQAGRSRKSSKVQELDVPTANESNSETFNVKVLEKVQVDKKEDVSLEHSLSPETPSKRLRGRRRKSKMLEELEADNQFECESKSTEQTQEKCTTKEENIPLETSSKRARGRRRKSSRITEDLDVVSEDKSYSTDQMSGEVTSRTEEVSEVRTLVEKKSGTYEPESEANSKQKSEKYDSPEKDVVLETPSKKRGRPKKYVRQGRMSRDSKTDQKDTLLGTIEDDVSEHAVADQKIELADISTETRTSCVEKREVKKEKVLPLKKIHWPRRGSDTYKPKTTLLDEQQNLSDDVVSEKKDTLVEEPVTEFLKPLNKSASTTDTATHQEDNEIILPLKKSKRVTDVNVLLNETSSELSTDKNALNDTLSFPNFDDSIFSTSLRNDIQGIIDTIEENEKEDDQFLEQHSKIMENSTLSESQDISKCVPPKKKKIDLNKPDGTFLVNSISTESAKVSEDIPQAPKKKMQKLFEQNQALEKLEKVDLPLMSPLAKKKSFSFQHEEFHKVVDTHQQKDNKETESISDILGLTEKPTTEAVTSSAEANLINTSFSFSQFKVDTTEELCNLPKKRKKRKSSSHDELPQKKERTSEPISQDSTVEVSNKEVVEHSNEMEVKLEEDDFKFSIQTNLSNIATSTAQELSAIATETLEEIKKETVKSLPRETVEQTNVESALIEVPINKEPSIELNLNLVDSGGSGKNNKTEVKKEDVQQKDIKNEERALDLESTIPKGIVLPSEPELVPIEGNLTVMSEKDLADAQVEITTDKVISEKKPTTLGSFSLDFPDPSGGKTIPFQKKKKETAPPLKTNTFGTEFTNKAMTKEFDNRSLISQPAAYLKSELLDILEGNSNSSTNSSGSDLKFKASFDNYDKKTTVQGIFDFEEAIPSQIVMSSKVADNVLKDSPKLLERLSMSGDTTKPKSQKVVIQSDIKVTDTITKGILNKVVKPMRTPKPGQKILIKTSKATSLGAVSSKPIILSEQIIRPATVTPKAAPVQPQGIKRQYEDIEESIEAAFIIPKIAKKTEVEEAEEVHKVPEKTPRGRGGSKSSGKAKILQQTIITSKGEIIQPLGVPATQADDAVFDINSMPIVISDDLLTPESIQNMPVVLSDDVIPQNAASVAVKGQEKTVPNLAKKIATSITTKPQIIFKTTQPGVSPSITGKQTVKPRILANNSSTPAKNVVRPPPAALLATGTTADGKPTKYVLVPSSITTQPLTPQAKTVKQSVIKKPGIVQSKLSTIQPPESPSQVVGSKIMIVTNQHGQQHKVMLTPQQQKVLMQNQSGAKVAKTIIKSAIPKPTLEQPTTPGPSGIVSKTSLSLVQQGVPSVPPASSHGGLLMPVTKTARTPVQNKKVTPKPTNKPQKTILIKNQLGQTVRKIQGTDDAELDRQVAEQLKAIKASARLQQANKPPEIINYTNRTISTGKPPPVRRSYQKKVDALKVKPIVAEPATGLITQTSVHIPKTSDSTIPALTPISHQTKLSQAQSAYKQVLSSQPASQHLPSKKLDTAQPTVTCLKEKTTDPAHSSASIPVHQETKTTVPATPTKVPESRPERPLNQLVIQDALGNQTTITEGQILALPSETVDGQPQSYVLVTLDETGNLTPLNNEALMSLDPSLGLGGDINNVVLQVDQGQGVMANIKPADANATVPIAFEQQQQQQQEKRKIEEKPKPEPVKAPPVQEIKPSPVQQVKPVVEEPVPIDPPQISIGEGVIPGGDPGSQQLIVTGDPIATQKFLESLSDGTTDLASLLANAEGGSVLIQADGQQILIKTNTEDAQTLLGGMVESTEGGGNPIFAPQNKSNQDILAAALADTDVFQHSEQPSVGQSSRPSSQLSPSSGAGGSLYPMHVGSVLETSLTLSSPIMTPLEVSGTNSKKIDDESEILNQVPKNIDLPITITDPNISQTVAHQQAAGLMELTLPIPETTATSVDINSPSSYSYSLPSLDDTVGISQKPFNGSMPLLTEDVVETEANSSSEKSHIGTISVAKGLQASSSDFGSFGSLPLLPETIETSREEVVKASNFGDIGSLPILSEEVIEDSGSSMDSSKPPKSPPKPKESDIDTEGLCTLGGEMCSSLSEPPPDMFDLGPMTAKEEEVCSDMSSVPEPEGETLSLNSEGSGEIPLQPQIVANLNDLKRPGEELNDQEDKKQKFD